MCMNVVPASKLQSWLFWMPNIDAQNVCGACLPSSPSRRSQCKRSASCRTLHIQFQTLKLILRKVSAVIYRRTKLKKSVKLQSDFILAPSKPIAPMTWVCLISFRFWLLSSYLNYEISKVKLKLLIRWKFFIINKNPQNISWDYYVLCR
jgi:hypothetical protein